jgi:hypothetical protein
VTHWGRATKKPVEISFMRWPGGAESATVVIDWVLACGGTARYHEASPYMIDHSAGVMGVPEHIAIDTLEGTMRAVPGDVVIRGVMGEFYPCKPDIFDRTYDLVEDHSL